MPPDGPSLCPLWANNGHPQPFVRSSIYQMTRLEVTLVLSCLLNELRTTGRIIFKFVLQAWFHFFEQFLQSEPAARG